MNDAPTQFFMVSITCYTNFTKISPSTSETATLSSLNNQPIPRKKSLSAFILAAFLICFCVKPSVPFNAYQICPAKAPAFSFNIFSLPFKFNGAKVIKICYTTQYSNRKVGFLIIYFYFSPSFGCFSKYSHQIRAASSTIFTHGRLA